MSTSRLQSFSLGAATAVAAGLAAIGSRKVATWAKIGKGHPLKHRLLDVSSQALQTKYPLEAMSTYLDGLHMYADDMGRQVEAAHFCIHLRHELHQCVIFDRNEPDARLIGIEYIISAERFDALPAEEKRLWHSHHYEVKSGILTAPGVPKLAERSYFEDLVSTYGKTFHTWQYDRDDFPFGIPQLMMGFTDDGQAQAELLSDRDARVGVSTQERRAHRENIPMPHVAAEANAWESGHTVQTTLRDVPLRRD
ncbi:OBAP family protein [Brevibacterium linens]|uniref:DUF1264 domain-containing protein n=1 Tax=Brevibacterium linens ATCC 9172 TaxID=1255617 RepID=A0A2H1K379_BRELN|nr:OBAP family protein [Brevibacterium linens]KAB1946430.1 DUF1264 domain-containing protein [Brevibacterium linens ATCC 9172]SMX94221.1 Protein of unknown function (DUF1264) [Brevibacterium linens ATCC 9172]